MAVMDRIARHTLLGGEVDVMDVGQLMAFVSDCAAARRRTVIANHNLNSLRLIRREPAMAALYARAERIQIDSMPLIGWGRLLGLPKERRRRRTELDWREAFWPMASATGWRVFHLGCAPCVGGQGLAAIWARHAGLAAGSRQEFFDMDG